MIVASVIALLSVSAANAWFGGRRGCCPSRRVASCAPRTVECAPKCFKRIKVPKTIEVEECVEVPARKIVIPQPDIVERIAQAPIEVRIPQPPIPQPDRVEYKCVPDKIVHHPQAPCIRYECPTDCEQR